MWVCLWLLVGMRWLKTTCGNIETSCLNIPIPIHHTKLIVNFDLHIQFFIGKFDRQIAGTHGGYPSPQKPHPDPQGSVLAGELDQQVTLPTSIPTTSGKGHLALAVFRCFSCSRTS